MQRTTRTHCSSLRRLQCLVAVASALALVLPAACRGGGGDGDGDGDADTDADGDSTADGDADGDSDGDADTDADGPGDMLTEAELERITSTLSSDEMDGRDNGTPGGAAARQFLIDEWTACGIVPAGEGGFEQPVTGGDGVNIVGRIEGSDPALRDRYVLLSAHYDHLGNCDGAICNGAYDNATALAEGVGVACTLAASPPARSILVAHWDAEEPPDFLTETMGSEFYGSHPIVPLAQTDVAIALDLVGADMWPGYEGHFVLGAETSPEVTAAVQAAAVPAGLILHRIGLHMGEESPLGHMAWSDYDAFRNRGVPVLFFTNGQNKVYHTAADEMDGVNVPAMAREAAHLLHVVEALANATATPVFDADGQDYAADATALVAVLEAAVAEGGLVDTLGLSSASRSNLESDLARVRTIATRLEDGGTATAADISALRGGTLRVMCLAGSTYDESLCNMF
jgi:hypothetical protein